MLLLSQLELLINERTICLGVAIGKDRLASLDLIEA